LAILKTLFVIAAFLALFTVVQVCIYLTYWD